MLNNIRVGKDDFYYYSDLVMYIQSKKIICNRMNNTLLLRGSPFICKVLYSIVIIF